MKDFLLKEDIKESTIQNEIDKFKLLDKEVTSFINEINGLYTEECLELGVLEENIMVYDPNVDAKDLRNPSLVKLCTYWFLEFVFFSYSDTLDDKKWQKYYEVQKLKNKFMTKLNYNRIIGESPSVIKTSNSFMVIKKNIGTM